MSGSSYYSHSDFRLHFGLGAASAVEAIEIVWPSGTKEIHRDQAANHLYTCREGEGIVGRRAFEKSGSQP
jgi:hypothetical protein